MKRRLRPWLVVAALSITWLTITVCRVVYTNKLDILWSLGILGSSTTMMFTGWYLHAWLRGDDNHKKRKK